MKQRSSKSIRHLDDVIQVDGDFEKCILMYYHWHRSSLLLEFCNNNECKLDYTVVKGSMAIATPKLGGNLFVRGHDKPRLMGVAIAIDPFQVV